MVYLWVGIVIYSFLYLHVSCSMVLLEKEIVDFDHICNFKEGLRLNSALTLEINSVY